MSKTFSAEQVARYERDGAVFPVRVLTIGEAALLPRRVREVGVARWRGAGLLMPIERSELRFFSLSRPRDLEIGLGIFRGYAVNNALFTAHPAVNTCACSMHRYNRRNYCGDYGLYL